MTKEERQRLRELAENASWMPSETWQSADWSAEGFSNDDADYLAAISPGVLISLLDSLDILEGGYLVSAEIERLEAALAQARDELALERQHRNGHLPTCAGQDEANHRCGCGYLDGGAYRELTEALAQAQQDARREVAWLVELQDNGQCRGWLHGDVDDGFGWTLDPNKAIRFSRKIDADKFRQRFGFCFAAPSSTHLSTEHVWIDAPKDEK